jgi:hypothetical protein
MTAAAVLTVAAIRATAALADMTNPSSLTIAEKVTVFGAVLMQAASILTVSATAFTPGPESPFTYWNGTTEETTTWKLYNGVTEVEIVSWELAP